MPNPNSNKTVADHQRVVDLIWSQMPHMQKRTSSSWWFFILFPRETEGYGPRQLMFAIATRAGQQIRIHGDWLPGLDLNRSLDDGVDRFSAMVNGWYCDGRQVHEDLVKGTAVSTLSTADKAIRCWSHRPGGATIGMEICESATQPLALETHVVGQKGAARFTAWGDLDCLHSSPEVSIDVDTAVGGVHFIAWRRMNFHGEFDLPTGRETLSGIGYFQRVCLNVPTFPWKWIWAVFPDGSLFSAYVPYVGLNLLRRGYHFFADNRKEQTAVSLFPAAFWDWPGPSEQIRFNQARVTPILGQKGEHPRFDVQVGNKQGDYVSFQAVPYGHANLDIDRPTLGGWLRMHWNYNEFMFRMEGLNGRVNGRPITFATMGQGFGSLEYTWGLGL
jgi:hypothetical protein